MNFINFYFFSFATFCLLKNKGTYSSLAVTLLVHLDSCCIFLRNCLNWIHLIFLVFLFFFAANFLFCFAEI